MKIIRQGRPQNHRANFYRGHCPDCDCVFEIAQREIIETNCSHDEIWHRCPNCNLLTELEPLYGNIVHNEVDPHDPDGGIDVMECPHKGRYIR